MMPLPPRPSAASNAARLLDNDPKKIALLIGTVCVLGGAMWWYDAALSRATDFHELRRLVYGGGAALSVAAITMAAVLCQIGRATIAQQCYPPSSRLTPVLLIVPGTVQVSGRAAVRRGRLLIGAGVGFCLWVLAMVAMLRHVEQMLIRERSATTHTARHT
jgi:hypothetical protein